MRVQGQSFNYFRAQETALRLLDKFGSAGEIWRDVPDGGPECIGSDVQAKQIKGVVHQYLLQHPADRHFPAHHLAMQAIMEAFCP